jgi:hypothetical protein
MEWGMFRARVVQVIIRDCQAKYPAAPLYFIVFNALAKSVFLNLYLATLLDKLASAVRKQKRLFDSDFTRYRTVRCALLACVQLAREICAPVCVCVRALYDLPRCQWRCIHAGGCLARLALLCVALGVCVIKALPCVSVYALAECTASLHRQHPNSNHFMCLCLAVRAGVARIRHGGHRETAHVYGAPFPAAAGGAVGRPREVQGVCVVVRECECACVCVRFARKWRTAP